MRLYTRPRPKIGPLRFSLSAPQESDTDITNMAEEIASLVVTD